MRLVRTVWRHRPRLSRRARLVAVFVCAAATLLSIVLGQGAPAQTSRAAAATPPVAAGSPTAASTDDEQDVGGERHGKPGIQDYGVPRSQLESEGSRLYHDTCSSCHGADLRGIPGRAPNLRGVGELSADFYLRTGRMPLDDPEDEPRRSESPFTERQIDSLIAYIGKFGGPGIQTADPSKGNLAEGMQLFTDKCMGCHQVVGQGGMTTRAWVPDLQKSEPVDVAEATSVAPYVMPHFVLSDEQVDSLARYVKYTQDPEDRGGWGIGHIGPIPEGMVTWMLAAITLLLVIRLIGERTTDEI